MFSGSIAMIKDKRGQKQEQDCLLQAPLFSLITQTSTLLQGTLAICQRCQLTRAKLSSIEVLLFL